jgi:hypothetical protein
MNPPLVKTTATWPVSALDGVLMPAIPTSKATKATLMTNFFMTFFPLKRRGATTTYWARSMAK